MYTNVLVPYDGSEPAQRALNAAIKLAEGAEPARVTVLKVTAIMEFDESTFAVAAMMAGVPNIPEEKKQETIENYVSESKKRMQDQIQEFFESIPQNIDFEIKVMQGRAQEVILDYARENKIDCIVMGRRGLGGIRAALGSVSTAVLRGTDLPVLVVR